MSWTPTTIDVVTQAIRVRHRNAAQIGAAVKGGLPDDLATMRERDLNRQIRELVQDLAASGSMPDEIRKEFGNHENG
ncbi:MAG: hypothetical protein V2A34_02500 [Lentisphaerota bacterium]